MNGIVLVQLRRVLDLAHHDDERGGAAEQTLLGAQVILPRGGEMGDALLEELVVELDVGHCDEWRAADGSCKGEGMRAMVRLEVDDATIWNFSRRLAVARRRVT